MICSPIQTVPLEIVTVVGSLLVLFPAVLCSFQCPAAGETDSLPIVGELLPRLFHSQFDRRAYTTVPAAH